MIINSPNIEKIINLEIQNNIPNGKLIMLSLMINAAKSTGFKKIKEKYFNNEEEYKTLCKILIENNLMTKSDISFIEKINKTMIKKENYNYEKEIEEIISHLSKITNKRLKITDNKRNLIKKQLISGYTVKDFKMVNNYFYDIWNNPEMEKYIREITLYNKKFPDRLEEASLAYEKLKKYENDFIDICKIFEAYFIEYVEYNIIEQKLITDNKECIYMTFSSKKRISFWLENGFKKEELIKTMIVTIISWSKNEELRTFISIDKIFDNKFRERHNIAKIKEIPFIKEDKAKTMLKEWYYNENKNNKLIEENKEYIIDIEEIEETDDNIIKSIFKKMKIW